jgi:quercetin dioxygenase-like cupin family protein
VKIVNEKDLKEERLPGRHMKWLASPRFMDAKNMSVCIVRLPEGETVRPAHAHPDGEEFIYVLKGRGRVMVDGEVKTVSEGTAVLFPAGSVHMLQNNGDEELKVICFFSPPADPSIYKYYEEVSFPE